MTNNKFRIFVDGSYDERCGIGTIAYHIQPDVEGIKLNIANNVFATRVFHCKNSFDAEICAIGLGFDMVRKLVGVFPILKTIPIRVKSDNLWLVKYITKGTWKTDENLDLCYVEDIQHLEDCYKWLKEELPNFKLSYINSKNNLAHKNAYEMLRLERGLLDWIK